MHHRWLRWTIQLLFLAFFIYLYIQTRYGVPIILQNILYRIDPLVFLITSIALRTMIFAGFLSLVLIAITMIFGRLFCGFVCPLGTLIDIGDTLTKKTLKQQLISWRPMFAHGKFLILIFLIMAAFMGASMLHFTDPLVIFFRTLTYILSPVITSILGSFSNVHVVGYTESILTIITITMIVTSGLIFTRFWCRTLCPLGALLTLLSKISLFKFSFTTECQECGICDRLCPTSAIRSPKQSIDNGECITCFRCLYECPKQIINYRVRPRPVSLNLTRRKVLLALGSGFLAAPLARSLLHVKLQERLIRPPGTIPEDQFLNACIRCSMCIKMCPTNGLQPCLFEAGMNGIWTPRLISRIGGCEKNCNRCGQICPTSAIRKLSLEEKTFVKMGTAVVLKSRCIAWEQDKVCLICDEACPFNAISSFNETIRGTTLLRPFVDERICTGCGLCEERCPVTGPAAIQIFAHGEERQARGSYITTEKKRLRECEEKPEDIPSGFITE